MAVGILEMGYHGWHTAHAAVRGRTIDQMDMGIIRTSNARNCRHMLYGLVKSRTTHGHPCFAGG